MATRSDVRATIDSLLGSDASLSDAEINSILTLRYTALYEKRGWSKRRRAFTITLVAQVSSITSNEVTVTVGLGTVTSAGTPWAAADDAKQIVIAGDVTPFFVNFVSSSSITLVDGDDDAVSWAAATDTSAAWRTFQTIYSLPSDCETVLTLTGDFDIEEMDGGIEALDAMDPDRSATGDHPRFWAYAGVDTAGSRQLEVWPVPSQNRLLRGTYLRTAPTLADGTTIDISVPLLAYGSAADCCGMLYAKTGDKSWQELQLFYERKHKEVDDDAGFSDHKHLNPPSSLGRRTSRSSRLGGDFWVSHDPGLV